METFFLGIIAFSMVFIAIMSLIRTIFWIVLALKLRDLLVQIQTDYRHMYPKILKIVDNVSGVSGVLGFFKLFKSFKSRSKK
ncbi:hypothetical protein [Sulfurihydrogenibium sp.]|uniref:hypothetical protein n=1 Tax=Sulfurihydrogenibium sp. TaxID=2053621 RepID=UPI003D1501BC